MAELAQKFGLLMYMQLSSVSSLVVSSPEMMREVLVTEDGQDGNSVNLNQAILAMSTNINTLMVMNKRKLTDLAILADAYTQKIVEQHQARQLNSYSTKVTDQVNLLSVMRKYQGKDGQYLDSQIIKAVILEVVVAATDEPWVVTEWAIAELLRHLKIMQKSREELNTLVEMARMVQESDLPNLPYFHAVVKETFRRHPPVLLIPHECTQATQIAGYDVPAQTRLFLNVWAMARNPSVWDRPTEFDPERFLHLNEAEKQAQKLKLLTFGLERRSCPGIRTGLLIVNLALAHLVHSFNWSSKEELDMTETSVELKLQIKVLFRTSVSKLACPYMNCTQLNYTTSNQCSIQCNIQLGL